MVVEDAQRASVADAYHRWPPRRRAQQAIELRFGRLIERRCWLVENEQLRIAQISPGQREFLPLAARKIHPAIETPADHFDEFLALSAKAWPDFESSYDSQVIGLWRIIDPGAAADVVTSLLLTRRPDLAMWERSKIPQGAKEIAMRENFNRRYDLCNSTVVYTTTLLTARDREDTARWT